MAKVKLTRYAKKVLARDPEKTVKVAGGMKGGKGTLALLKTVPKTAVYGSQLSALSSASKLRTSKASAEVARRKAITAKKSATQARLDAAKSRASSYSSSKKVVPFKVKDTPPQRWAADDPKFRLGKGLYEKMRKEGRKF